MELTEANVHEAKAVLLMLNEIERLLVSVTGDGSYDRQKVYQALQGHILEVRIAIP